MRPIRLVSLIALVSLVFGSAQAYALTPPIYSLTGTLSLPGAVRWDYLTFDTQNQRLFITRGDSVDVLDITGQNIVSTIPNTSGVHGVALAPDINEGFISDGMADTVTIFDLTTLETLTSVPTGMKPDAIVYEASTKRVYTANGNSNDVTAIDTKTNAVLDTIKLDGKPEFAVVDEHGHLYINIEDKAEIAVIDTKNLKVITTYDLKPTCESPTGLAIDRKNLRLFSVCGNLKMVITSAKTGKMIDVLPIGAHSDAAVFDPDTGLAFSSNGDGTLTVVSQVSKNHYQVIQTVKTKPTARTMALNPTTHDLYLAAAETNVIGPLSVNPPPERPHMKPDSFMILTVHPETNSPELSKN
jgi:YVTN family beta-propeller protein